MLFYSKDRCTVIETKDIRNTMGVKELIAALSEKTNNTVYFVAENKLYGLLTSGDIIREYVDKTIKEIKINTSFTKINEGDYYGALNTFYERNKINTLPVVKENGEFVGEYNKMDEIVAMHRGGYGLEEGYVEMIARTYDNIGIAIPNKDTHEEKIIIELCKSLKQSTKRVSCLYGKDIYEKYLDFDCIFSVNRNECWGMDALGHLLDKKMFLNKKKWFFDIYDQIGYDEFYERRETELCYQQIQKQGVKVINVWLDVEDEYAKQLQTSILEKNNGNKDFKMLYGDGISEYFFDELYSEEYVKYVGYEYGVTVKKNSGFFLVEDMNNPYINYKDGFRFVCGQPEEFEKTIWILGGCFLRGAWYEDKNTIETVLQEILNSKGYKIRVVNAADTNAAIPRLRHLVKLFNEKIKPGDIVICHQKNYEIMGVKNINLLESIKKQNPSPKWFYDDILHPNHKIIKKWATQIFSELEENDYLKNLEYSTEKKEIKDIISVKRLEEIFLSGIDISQYQNVGAIIMNCNPFTYGHRYLIETAKESCDFLLVFVVEEDASLFSFYSRYAMVKEGVKDLSKVFVIPSGDFILSKNNFPGYFIKVADSDTQKDAEYDIEIFARDIAPKFNITKRYVGEELADEVTQYYNEAMKKILPKYGIELIEIPRKKVNGKAISATSVRNSIKNNEMAKLKKLVPQSTIDIILWEVS